MVLNQDIGVNKRDFFINFSKNSRANKLLSILQKDVSLKTYNIINYQY